MRLRLPQLWIAIALSIDPTLAMAAHVNVPVVSIAIKADGSILLDGVKYSTASALKLKLDQITHRKPKPNLVLVAQHATSIEAIGRATVLLQKAGVPKFGVLIEPYSSLDTAE